MVRFPGVSPDSLRNRHRVIMQLPRLFQSEHQPDLQPALTVWYAGELGEALLDAEAALLADILPELFGYHAVQLGQVVRHNLLAASRINHRVIAGLAPDVPGLSPLRAHLDQLPLTTGSVDLVLVHHGVDTAASAHDLLREAGRVLIPGGHLLVVGFNPWSLWGLWRLFRMPWSQQPWLRRFVSPQRLADWMRLLDFEVVGLESAFFLPPVNNPGVRHRFGWLERLGPKLWSQGGASYVLLARKHEACVTPVRNRIFTAQRALGPILVEPRTSLESRLSRR